MSRHLKSSLSMLLPLSILVPLLILVAPWAAASQPTVEQILSRADDYRLTDGSVQVMTRVRLFDNAQQFEQDRAAKERLYQVLIKPGRRSLE